MIPIPEELKRLSKLLPKPLYAVGGYVRNFLIDGSLSKDLDLASANREEELMPALKECGLEVVSEYKRTGTIVFKGSGRKYEYTRFRTEEYLHGGNHSPTIVEFTDDVKQDAIRRDFKCNAIYYDINAQEIVDVLGGVEDVKNRILDTVTDANKVFSHDGLRLMRLARFSAELDFTPTMGVIESATRYAKNILDISPERIYAELKMILQADGKYPFSNKNGHYNALKMLSEIGVLDYIIPELTLGRGMEQRGDFHDHDVLEHSLRTVLYAPTNLRLDALLHDVGKPYCQKTYGNFHLHHQEGVRICQDVLTRLKADNNTIERIKFIVKEHMKDVRGDMKETKVKLFIAKNQRWFSELLAIKQADYSACKDDLSIAPIVKRWTEIYEKMLSSNTPMKPSEISIDAKTLVNYGLKGAEIGKELNRLWEYVILHPQKNSEKALLNVLAKKYKK